jgi:hypothetical protein
LLEGGQAKKAWSKFGTFGIQMLAETRTNTPLIVLGYDVGTKFEGIVVVSGTENVLAVKLDLPEKSKIVKKMKERRELRHTRRQRKYRRRPVRTNRKRKPFIAPSQAVVVGSRLKILGACFKLYPITVVGNENVCFDHKKRWGANFSTMEIGKSRIKQFFEDQGVQIYDFQGYETEEIRKKYGYKKTSSKSADKFEAHCSDALALACEVGMGDRVEPGCLIVVDDTYRQVRRRLHKINFSSGGIKKNNSKGPVNGLHKGILIGTPLKRVGQLRGKKGRSYRYVDERHKDMNSLVLSWVSTQFLIRRSAFRI